MRFAARLSAALTGRLSASALRLSTAADAVAEMATAAMWIRRVDKVRTTPVPGVAPDIRRAIRRLSVQVEVTTP
jgi:hypothetical protein